MKPLAAKQSDRFALDNALRQIVNYLPAIGGQLMAIRFTLDRTRYEVDTPEEAQRLRELYENQLSERAIAGDRVATKHLLRHRFGWTEERFWQVIEVLKIHQIAFLQHILYHKMVYADDMQRMLGLRSQVALAGVIAGVTTQLRNAGIKPSELYRVETYWNGKTKRRFFVPADGFDVIADEVDWIGTSGYEATHQTQTEGIKGGTDAASTKAKAGRKKVKTR